MNDADAAARDDCFAPPAQACELFCLHCRRAVDSDAMWYQRIVNAPDGRPDGTWMCPTPNCDGIGFCFDLWPTDPDHPANEGSFDDDGTDEDFSDDDSEDDDDQADAAYDPAEPAYAALDEAEPDDDDLEGEEWKFGLAAGERPPAEPDDAERRAWEAEDRRYDEPDERPRTVDGSQWARPEATRGGGDDLHDDDIPF